MSIGDRVRETRKAKGLSQQMLAERAGTTQQTVTGIETGARKAPHYSTLYALARALDVSVEYLTTGNIETGDAIPKAPGLQQLLPADWLEEVAGHAYLAMTDEQAHEEIRQRAHDADELERLQALVDVEYAVVKEALSGGPFDDTLNAAQKALLQWRLDLFRARRA